MNCLDYLSLILDLIGIPLASVPVFYSTDNTFIHGSIDRLGCVEQHVIGPENISQRINDLNLQDCHAKIRQIESHSTIGDGVVVQ
ncbi:unnamed protein product, partial [Rotaria sp. Silwood1]